MIQVDVVESPATKIIRIHEDSLQMKFIECSPDELPALIQLLQEALALV